MRHKIISLALLTALAPAYLISQGWEFAGPDSATWQDVNRVSVRWLSASSYRLAVATGRGIAFTYPNGMWGYSPNFGPNPAFPGRTFSYAEFSPWTDTMYVGYAEIDFEPWCRLMMLSLTGGSWQPVWPMGCWSTPYGVVHGPDRSTVYASACGFFRSTDGGSTWVTLDSNQAVYRSRVLAIDNASTSIIFRAGNNQYSSSLNSTYRSTNRGVTWDSIFSIQTNLLYHDYPQSVFAQGDSILVGINSAETDTSRVYGIYRSTDRGGTWSRVYIRGRVVGIVKSAVTPGTLFAASEEGILRSLDFGAAWSPYNNSLPTTHITSLAIGPYSDTMFVSTTTHGVLKVWQFLTGVSEGTSLPDEITLEQNYPNPFNPVTTIRFTVGTRHVVSLHVFDIMGREVATLVNEDMGPGRYERTLDASGIPSGVYFYRLQVNGYAVSKKMIVVH